MLPPYFDATPTDNDQRVRLDHKILDQHVITVLEQIYNGDIPFDFATRHPLLADSFFSEPYCHIATNILGYIPTDTNDPPTHA